MARTKTQNKPKKKGAVKRATSPPRPTPRNSAVLAAVDRNDGRRSISVETRNSRPRRRETEPDSPSFGERVRGLSLGQAAVGLGTGYASHVAGMVAVGQGWVRPKTAALSMTATGVLASAGGHYLDSDVLTSMGLGLTLSGSQAVITVYGADAYEAVEQRVVERKALKAAADQALAESTEKNVKPKQRNVRRLIVLNSEAAHDFE